MKPYPVPLRVLVEATEALRQVHEVPYGTPLPFGLASKVANAYGRIMVYADMNTAEVQIPISETEVAP